MLLVQYNLLPESMPAVQGNCGIIYGHAVYNPSFQRHEFRMRPEDYRKAHKDLALALRRRGCQWLAIHEEDAATPAEKHLNIELAELRGYLELAEIEIAEKDALIADLRKTLAATHAPETPPEATPASAPNPAPISEPKAFETKLTLPDGAVENLTEQALERVDAVAKEMAGDAPKPTAPIGEPPTDYKDLLAWAKSELGLFVGVAKPKTAKLTEAVQAALAKRTG